MYAHIYIQIHTVHCGWHSTATVTPLFSPCASSGARFSTPRETLTSVIITLSGTVAHRPDPVALGLQPIKKPHWYSDIQVCNGWMHVRLDPTGSLSSLQTLNGAVYADPSHLLAEPVIHVSSPAQRRAWAFGVEGEGVGYMNDPGAASMFFKLDDPLGTGVGYRPAMTSVYRNDTTVLVRLMLPADALEDFGSVEEMWMKYHFERTSVGGCAIDVTFTEINKTATRITESHWLRFHPTPTVCPSQMRLHKIDSLVDPIDIVYNGSRTLHAVQRGVIYHNPDKKHGTKGGVYHNSDKKHDTKGGVYHNSGHKQQHLSGSDAFNGLFFSVETVDAPVVKIGAGNASLAPTALLHGLNPAPVPNDRAPDLSGGFAVNLENNLWNTNGIEWFPYDKEGRSMQYRFRINVPPNKSVCA